MRWSLLGRLGLLPAFLAVAVVACNEDPIPADPTPTPEPTVTVTETFTGTVATDEQKVHRFVVRPGVVRTTVVSVTPSEAPVFGIVVGLWDPSNESCFAVITRTAATVGTELVGTARQGVEMCVQVFDPGDFPDGTTIGYELKVVHETAPPSS
ncbi:MAG: hypothetical protein ACE148_10150 [Vicinamibacterales bacterium]